MAWFVFKCSLHIYYYFSIIPITKTIFLNADLTFKSRTRQVRRVNYHPPDGVDCMHFCLYDGSDIHWLYLLVCWHFVICLSTLKLLL